VKLTPLGIKGAWLAESKVWNDDRGFFREWFKESEVLSTTGINFLVKQANFSVSQKGAIRGIHYSLTPHEQAKWITCVSGAIVDVIVDIRPESSTFKEVEYVDLKPGDGKSVLISHGLGHGFISIENGSGVSYLLNAPYNPDLELGINPFDQDLGINWEKFSLDPSFYVVSESDQSAPSLKELLDTGRLPSK
jgi:dTDP-4-dehydrorhamnose 3,5-epimerase